MKVPIYTDHVPTQKLFEIAYKMSRGYTPGEINLLGQAVDHCCAQIQDRERHPALIQEAKNIYEGQHGHDLEIDGHPILSEGDEGVWVQAWVWVTKEEMNAD